MILTRKISRRAVLRCAGLALTAAAAGSLLSGCGGSGGSIEVAVGDQVNNWNGLAVRLAGLFSMDVAPAAEGKEYVGVLVAVKNKNRNYAYAIGAQNILEIDAAYPVPPSSNVDLYVHALSEATADFSMACDGEPVEGGAYLYVYNAATNVLADAPTLPPNGVGYIELVCVAPLGWQELEVTYSPTFAEGKTITFKMQASEVIRAAADDGSDVSAETNGGLHSMF